MPDKKFIDYTYKIKDYLRSAEVVEGKNIAYSQENNAVIATIENGKSYKVRWTGSATITLKKDSASGTEVTSGSTSPLSFTADSDFDLYFGSSADVTEIMVYDGNDTSDTYEPYYVPVKDRCDELDEIIGDEWETVIPTIESQTKYEYRSISSIKRKGKIIQGVIRIKSLTGNEMPMGKTYTTVASGLPQIPADLQFFIPSGTSLSNNPLEVLYNTNGTITMRGGSIDDYYNCSFVGWIV